jgi:hypothetical protein
MDSESFKLLSYAALLGTLTFRFVKHWRESLPAKTAASNVGDSISLDALAELIKFHIPSVKNG